MARRRASPDTDPAIPLSSAAPPSLASGGQSAPMEGVLIRAENGDVVTWDETGLTLRLSDTVLNELRKRLPLPTPRNEATALGDIDVWNLRDQDGWLFFDGRLDPALGPRSYRRAHGGGDIIAAAPGPLLGLFALGGQRRAGFSSRPIAYRHHILAPGDDIGAVGLEGTAEAERTARLQHLPWPTREALLAECLLSDRLAAGRALPLHICRAETDGSASIDDLQTGPAFANLMTAIDNGISAASSLGTRLSVPAIGLDFGLEDRLSDAPTLARGLRRLMARIEAELIRRGIARPVFLMMAESGTARETTHPAIAAHATLSWQPGPHRLTVVAPGYMFEQTAWGRPTDAARARMARMDAFALIEALARRDWHCPTLLLAEAEDTCIRVTAQSMGPLVLSDALAPGPTMGFRLTGTDARVTGVAIAPDDAKALILTTDRPAVGGTLHYAHGADPMPGHAGLPPNRGGLRDDWQAPCPDGGSPLHRWALPALLPVWRA